ncbi:MAG: Nif3-like dinuclear metal center hexameric protein [Flavobacteriales bacterium]|nr:Nif3-like dinuclear metal center hexameric protein [Flavobacteriales bacterium]
MKVKEITAIIEAFAPLSFQESYDNSGLIVGHPDDEVSGVLICMDCIEEVVDEALASQCNMIISHHPIVFSGLKKLNGKNYIERVVLKAVKNNIAIYAAHTNLDNAPGGVSFRMAEKIGLQHCKVLQPKESLLSKVVCFCPVDAAEKVRQAMFDAGAGHIGRYAECSFHVAGTGTFKAGEEASPYVGEIGKRHEEPELRVETVVPNYLLAGVLEQMLRVHPYEEVAYDVYPIRNKLSTVGSGVIGELPAEQDELMFLNSLKTSLNTACVRHTGLLQKPVKRVALCGGSGSFLLPDAMAAGADVLITGDFKYHQFFDAEDRIVIADVGHYESEQYTTELIYDILIKKIPNFAVRLSKKNTNPVNYL